MAGQTKPSAIDDILAEHAGLEAADCPTRRCTTTRRPRAGSESGSPSSRPIMSTYTKLTAAQDDLEAARELAADDSSFAAEMPELEAAGRRARADADRSTCARAIRTTATTSCSK